jgi:tRNA-Thr(GGU) m(6)t(6)A37 methyltransferase TsaA
MGSAEGGALLITGTDPDEARSDVWVQGRHRMADRAESANPVPELHAIGFVRSPVREPKDMPHGGVEARIELDPRYTDGLQRIDEHSHLWILSWFHRGDRSVLQVQPVKLDPDAPMYGVFGLRAFKRPNPIGLSLVALQRVEGNVLYVSGLDAIDGTPVLDTKAYFERDCVFSPRAPVLRPTSRETRWTDLQRFALQHHQESCDQLLLGARMSLIAEETVGKLTSSDLTVRVEGSRCLADTIQGLTRARFSNPPRFTFVERAGTALTEWRTPEKRLVLRANAAAADWRLDAASDEELFSAEVSDV